MSLLIQINLYWAILQTYLALERSLKRERCRTRKEKKTERGFGIAVTTGGYPELGRLLGRKGIFFCLELPALSSAVNRPIWTS